MSIADAMRTRALEARVTDLERRVAEIEFKAKPEPSPAAKKFAENLASRPPPPSVDDAA